VSLEDLRKKIDAVDARILRSNTPFGPGDSRPGKRIRSGRRRS